MTDVHEMVRMETERFEKALPRLLENLSGRWVVFKDNTVKADFDTEAEAYTEGLNRYGVDGGFVVAEVAKRDPELLTAGVVYGLDLIS